MPERVRLLRGTTLLGGVAEAVLLDLAGRTRLRRWARGEQLLAQGEPGGSVLVLVEGAVTVFRSTPAGRAALAHVRPPGVLGELTVLDGAPRTAGAEATEPTAALQLTRADLLERAAADPALLNGLLASLGVLLRQQSERGADVVLLDLPGRTAKQLLALAGGGGGPQVVRLNQTRLAELVGGTRQSMNHVLGEFVARGLVHREGREIVLDDLESLRRRAGVAVRTP